MLHYNVNVVRWCKSIFFTLKPLQYMNWILYILCILFEILNETFCIWCYFLYGITLMSMSLTLKLTWYIQR